MGMKAKNPFLTTGYESPEYFCDREDETKRLAAALENDRNVTLMAPRRLGKTGLILHTLHGLRESGYRVVYLDVFPAQNLADFTRSLAATAFRSLESGMSRMLQSAARFREGNTDGDGQVRTGTDNGASGP